MMDLPTPPSHQLVNAPLPSKRRLTSLPLRSPSPVLTCPLRPPSSRLSSHRTHQQQSYPAPFPRRLPSPSSRRLSYRPSPKLDFKRRMAPRRRESSRPRSCCRRRYGLGTMLGIRRGCIMRRSESLVSDRAAERQTAAQGSSSVIKTINNALLSLGRQLMAREGISARSLEQRRAPKSVHFRPREPLKAELPHSEGDDKISIFSAAPAARRTSRAPTTLNSLPHRRSSLASHRTSQASIRRFFLVSVPSKSP